MSGFAEYERYDALGLAGLVRRREVTPSELLDAALARAAARDPSINAITMPLEDYARRKGWSVAETERWLGPNLGYDPEGAA